MLEEVDHKTRSSFTLPLLKELTIGRHCSIELSEIKDENAPNLSALALERKTRLDAWYPRLSSFTPWNLDVFVLDWRFDYNWPESLPNVLVNFKFSYYAGNETRSVLRSGVEHIRLCSTSIPNDYTHVLDLEGILKIVREKSKPLQTLILPPMFDIESFPSVSVPNKNFMNRSRQLAQELVGDCLARKIELIFEEQPGRFDSRISKAFVRKMERLARARQEAEQQQEEEEKAN